MACEETVDIQVLSCPGLDVPEEGGWVEAGEPLLGLHPPPVRVGPPLQHPHHRVGRQAQLSRGEVDS